MKSMTKQKLADKAGVSLNTLNIMKVPSTPASSRKSNLQLN